MCRPNVLYSSPRLEEATVDEEIKQMAVPYLMRSLLPRNSLFCRRRCLAVTNKCNFSEKGETTLKLQYLDGNDSGIAVIGMNRPKARNALNIELVERLTNAIEAVEFDNNVKIVIIRSLVNGIYCAGADLKERSTIPIAKFPQFVSKLHHMVAKVGSLQIPAIAAVDGAAMGGGLELAMACDITVAANSARMGLVETSRGIMPGAGGTQRLPVLVGPANAKELIFTAKVVDGIEAERIGLVNYSVPQNETHDAAFQRSMELAREILQNVPAAVRMAKLAINDGLRVSGLASGLAFEESYHAQANLQE